MTHLYPGRGEIPAFSDLLTVKLYHYLVFFSLLAFSLQPLAFRFSL